MVEEREIPPIARDWEDAKTNQQYWWNRTVESHPCIDCLKIKENNNSYSIRAKLSGIEKCWLHLTDDEKESYLCWLFKLKTIEHSIRGFNLYMIKTPIRYDLSNCDLQAVNFEKAKLKKINMMLSNLEGANLSKTLLKGAYLSRTILKSSLLVRSILVSAELDDSDLTSADCDSAAFDDANLQNCNFTSSNLQSASIKGRLLDGVIFKGCNLSWSKPKGSFFSNVDFSDANLWHAFFENTNIWFCNLKRANFNQTFLNGAKIIASELQDAKLVDAQLEEAILGSSNFENANFQRANISGAKFESSNFNCAHLYYAVNTLKSDDDFGFCDMSKFKTIGEEKDKQCNFAAEIYMQIKNNLKQNGRYHFAEKMFYKEMVCRRKELKKNAEEQLEKSKSRDNEGKRQGSKFLALVKYANVFLNWLVYDLFCGYGTKTKNVFISGAFIVISFGLLCWISSLIGCKSGYIENISFSNKGFDLASLWSSLYFSGVTFTTLGFGKLEPHGWICYLVFIESVLGIITFATLIYCYGRKIAS